MNSPSETEQARHGMDGVGSWIMAGQSVGGRMVVLLLVGIYLLYQ